MKHKLTILTMFVYFFSAPVSFASISAMEPEVTTLKIKRLSEPILKKRVAVTKMKPRKPVKNVNPRKFRKVITEEEYMMNVLKLRGTLPQKEVRR